MAMIFMSYRREDAPGMAGWIHDKLRDRYGKDVVFRDIDQIEPGADFEKSIGIALRRCDVFIALMGKDWLGRNADGTLRINQQNDWIASEVEMALRLGIPIVPTLVDRATMPARADMPERIRDLAKQNALSIDASDFDQDIQRLYGVVDAKLPAGWRKAPKGERFMGSLQPDRLAKAIGEKIENTGKFVADNNKSKAVPIAIGIAVLFVLGLLLSLVRGGN